MSKSGKPITAQRIEDAMDLLAECLVNLGTKEAEIYLPIYQRLERELAAYRQLEDTKLAVFERARRLQDRTSARSA
ncbi:MAG TPA: hypothetical protein VGV39_04805 [Mesorhizobium sp.]|jgi:hypothetical protein|uniref:hypothetical protein n=1 Tax=Mesorhizobium sp. TaxID=1871066 RepID=UPI002DDD4B33|nr:hypothetical protein [Mesorhizobium sp.]HEV2502369.1 hypothetical protein [Mesorhizobium sp.]